MDFVIIIELREETSEHLYNKLATDFPFRISTSHTLCEGLTHKILYLDIVTEKPTGDYFASNKTKCSSNRKINYFH